MIVTAKNYILTVDEWRRPVRFREFDGMLVEWTDHKRGDVISLDVEVDDVVRLVEAGAIREETDEDREAAAQAAAPEPTPEPVVSEEPGGDSYDDQGQWSFDDLKNLAGDRDLSKAGSRADIIERLRAFDAANA